MTALYYDAGRPPRAFHRPSRPPSSATAARGTHMHSTFATPASTSASASQSVRSSRAAAESEGSRVVTAEQLRASRLHRHPHRRHTQRAVY
jgi:hypothetical protein